MGQCGTESCSTNLYIVCIKNHIPITSTWYWNLIGYFNRSKGTWRAISRQHENFGQFASWLNVSVCVSDSHCLVKRINIGSSKLNPQGFLSIVYSTHSNLNFTCELENSSELPILHVRITRLAHGTHQREVYKEPTCTDHCIHFDSFVFCQQKPHLIHCKSAKSER